MRGQAFTDDDVIRYYTASQWLYRLFCYDPTSLGMHFGFWDQTTRNRQQAITQENDYVITAAGGIQPGMKVLDAGCGVGGTALHIARKAGAHVWGITITPSQALLAKKYAARQRMGQLTTFSVGDFTKLPFADNYFDAVIGIESICYASPKSSFLAEAYRVLKPGGKLVIADGYLGRQPKDQHEAKIIEDFTQAFVMNEFVSPSEMLRQIRGCGFVRTTATNMLRAIEPSVRHFRTVTNRSRFACLAAKYIPIRQLQAIYKNYTALRTAGEGYELGLAAYYVHTGVKPES